jgi:hypothetical protein
MKNQPENGDAAILYFPVSDPIYHRPSLFKYSSLLNQPSVPKIISSKLPLGSVDLRAGVDSQKKAIP